MAALCNHKVGSPLIRKDACSKTKMFVATSSFFIPHLLGSPVSPRMKTTLDQVFIPLKRTEIPFLYYVRVCVCVCMGGVCVYVCVCVCLCTIKMLLIRTALIQKRQYTACWQDQNDRFSKNHKHCQALSLSLSLSSSLFFSLALCVYVCVCVCVCVWLVYFLCVCQRYKSGRFVEFFFIHCWKAIALSASCVLHFTFLSSLSLSFPLG